MRPRYTILLCHFAGATALYLNGQEAMRVTKGVATRRKFIYPHGTQDFTVRQVPAPLPEAEATLGGLVVQAVQLLGRLPGGEGNHSRLVMIGEDGQIESFINGLPVALSEDAEPLPGDAGGQFVRLAVQADLECAQGD